MEEAVSGSSTGGGGVAEAARTSGVVDGGTGDSLEVFLVLPPF